MEPSEIDAIIDSTIGGAIPRSLAALNFRRQLLEAIASLRNAMTDTPVGAYFGIFPQDVHESLVVVRQTFELVAPVASAAPDARVHDLSSTCSMFVAALGAATAHPQGEHEMHTLLVRATEVRENFADVALTGAMVRLAFEAAKGSSLAVVREQENSVSQIKNDIESYRAELKGESDRLLNEVAARGAETVARTKKQVRDIVLENAKLEFARARTWLWVQVGIWSTLSIVCIATFFVYCFRVIEEQHLPESWTWQIAYYTGIRILIIAAIGAIISFCLRMLKGHIRLVHINGHRSRLVNSIADFVEAAPGDKQFEIFRILIDTVVASGPADFADGNPETIGASGKIAEHLVARVGQKE